MGSDYPFSIQSAAHSPQHQHIIMKIALAFLLTLAVVSCQVPDLCPTCVKEFETADYAVIIAGIDVALADGELCTDCPLCTPLDDKMTEFLTLAKQLLEAGTDATLLCQLMHLCPERM